MITNWSHVNRLNSDLNPSVDGFIPTLVAVFLIRTFNLVSETTLAGTSIIWLYEPLRSLVIVPTS